MKDKKHFSGFWRKALRKYRFVIMTADSFEEKLSTSLSRLNIFAFVGFLVFFCFFISLLAVTYTPLSEYVPGKARSEVQQELIILTKKSDSLLAVLESQDVYLKNIRNIVTGGGVVVPEKTVLNDGLATEVSFERSAEDSIFRINVEAEEKGIIHEDRGLKSNIVVFYPPIKGLITDRFNPKTKHFGVDLVAKEKTKVSTVLSGTVIISHWTSETGHVIGVQHKNDYISLYKHNSILLKSVGDFVTVGQPIAIIGNSGELSSGPHLHFELWHRGVPVNPENYILF